MSRIAIVGIACTYPDATTPRELWENAVAGRRAFRRLPDVRMRLDDYWNPDPTVPDTFYAQNAAVLEGWEFDRVAHRIAGSTYRSTDLTHWLALDTATRALADAGFPAGQGLPRPRTGVIVGNTLTGEFSRANGMRLRWPYVRRVLADALKDQNWDDDRLGTFLQGVEEAYKKPFPPVDEDTLAGGLSNTIAGRICNHFDLNGGGYTVDGACSSSLLSVTTAATALLNGDLDVAVAGGVDLSIDPFEIIGFAKTGALAKNDMRLYDRGSNGFWPGEGCGMVVLMREQDALAAERRVYASVAGWGISSDGQGGITRPEVNGYQLALSRAYERAGFDIRTVPLFEGHGTGTAVGDATELKAIMGARAHHGPRPPTAAISSIKGMIGHTKAAAGIAGLIKTVMALDTATLPPAIGCVDPHELLTDDSANLRVLRKAEPWPDNAPLRAGITAMGFGGINTHVVLDKPAPTTPRPPSRRATLLANSLQDAELLLLDAESPQALTQRLTQIADFAAQLSYAQLGDLAATLQRELRELPYRAAAVVTSPQDAERRLRQLATTTTDTTPTAGRPTLLPDGRTFLGKATPRPRIGFLFPGQGSGTSTGGGALARRFTEAADVYTHAGLPTTGDMVATDVAQPRIVTGSTAGLRVLDTLGIEAGTAVGHSLGELTALHWAGALDAPTLLDAARTRGTAMAQHSASGTMASLTATPEETTALAEGLPVVISGYNGPRQTVVAGTAEDIGTLTQRAQQAGTPCTRLAVSHAFHSPLVAPAADSFGDWLTTAHLNPVQRRVLSTVTGTELEHDTDLAALLRRQITDPVLFTQAVRAAATEADLFIEVGPGHVLSTLATATTGVPALTLNTDDESLRSLLQTVGAAYVLGAPLIHERLFNDRLTRPLEIGTEFRFLTSPCEQAPQIDLPPTAPTTAGNEGTTDTPGPATDESALDVLRTLIAERAELPPELLDENSSLLDDLHMSSITVGQIVNQTALRLGLTAAHLPTNFATATVAELAEALTTLAETGTDTATPLVTGAAPWTRPFSVDLDTLPLPAAAPGATTGTWELFTTKDHPFAHDVHHALENTPVGPGVLVCLPPACTPEQIEHALNGARAALTGEQDRRFVLVQHDRGAAALAKTLHLEAPHLRTTVVHTPAADGAAARVAAEVAATTRFSEVHLTEDGTRRVPVLRALPFTPARTDQILDHHDVLLVTGGGKGITAECAMAVARETGAALAVLGRSDPAQDKDLAANLRRMTDSGIRLHYTAADVTDPARVSSAVTELTEKLGPVTAVLHGAGRNEPASLTTLDMTAVHNTFAPKVDGLHNILDAVGENNLKLLVTFGSIIGRAGLRGEAHYATANEWLAGLTQDIARRNPALRALCMEWSVWSGVGMGEKLSVVESLSREGIAPVSPDQGIDILLRLITDPDAPVVTVISGRTEGIDTVRRDLPPIPLLRFTGAPLLRYHGVELVTEVELNAGTDLYLTDHLLDGNLLMPAVIGMEAMTQVASAVTGRRDVPVIEDARFLRPIVVPPTGTTRIRVAATVTGTDTVDVAVHTQDTGFAAEHFRARLLYSATGIPDGPPDQTDPDVPHAPLDPAADLYGGILFQGERFRRLRRFHRAAARHVDADVTVGPPAGWFAGFLPGTLLLADPGMRDALMHGNQVCVPDATLLPSGIERLYPMAAGTDLPEEVRYCATERHRDGDTYVYDIAVRTPNGTVVERWEGLTLHAVRKTDGSGPWVAPLLGSYLERTLEEVLGTHIDVAVEPDPPQGLESTTARRAATARAVQRALGRSTTVRYRPDGRPELDDGTHVSAAHGPGVTLGVTATTAVACDIEAVTLRGTAQWEGLLAQHAELAALIAKETGETPDTAATRVWCAVECLKKAGLMAGAPLTLAPQTRPGWAVLHTGGPRIATFVTTLRGVADPVALAFLTDATPTPGAPGTHGPRP
ncbi:type I polyketide synthase [Streptomyces sp. NBC_01754]|uniref:type I polyketide synthase n=1 Tax=Streptomyces sp. NBC_01754 TaxID=2975930 RepID=UPI002DD7DBBE|nr:type I polyketide synthase [Streptomyces sp. NBC_01754]WSC90961.1 type I polyketide synthase [Streptomyces sp. NBC_01754]WSC96545.1 type I polyketide synthase [Streptomyces sp. NBC_01754]